MLQMAKLHQQSDKQKLQHNNSNNDDEYIRNQFTRRQQQSFYACTKTTSLILWICCCCLFFISNINKTNAVPTTFFAVDHFGVNKMSSSLHLPLLQRSARETSLNGNLMQQQELAAISSTEGSALDQPAAGQCLLDGVLVTEATVICEQQMGCRAIQKTGHCCPDYKCDCEKDGKVYLNGDKLVDPETPCTVCYCKGGEILCSPVSCFQRDDCTPKFVPGRCCPEYDNCPVVKSETSTTANWTLPSELTDSTTSASTPLSESVNHPEKSKITIKEITKPTEIRIVNSNKVIPIQQQLAKPSTTPSSISNVTEAPKHEPIPTTAPTTILSAIPMVQATSSNRSTEPTEQNDKTTTNTLTVESTTSTTLTKNQEAITVLSNVPATDSANKVNIKREYLFSREGLPLLHYGFGQYANTDAPQSSEAGIASIPASAESEPETAGSDNVYHIVLTTDGPRLVSTEGINVESSTAVSTEGSSIETTEGALKEMHSISTATPTTEHISDAEMNNTQSTESPSISTEANTPRWTTESLHHLDDDEATLPVESNPAYPSLPEDDFSLRDVNFPLSETDDIIESDEPRSIGGSAFKKVLKIEDGDNIMPSIDGSGDGSDQSAISSTTMSTATDDDSSVLTNVELMPTSHEDSSEEVHISNSTDFETKQHLTNEPKTVEDSSTTDDSQELTSLECVDGSSSSHCYSKLLNKTSTREPTTPRPTRRPSTEVDIDELSAAGSGDGSLPAETADDPKLDAESLKLDEKDDNGIASAIDKPSKTNILSIQTKPSQDKTIVELPTETETAGVDGSGRLQRLQMHVFI